MTVLHDFAKGDRVVWTSVFAGSPCPGCGRKHKTGIVKDVAGFYDVGVQFRHHPCLIRIPGNHLRKKAEYQLEQALKGAVVR